MNDQYAHYDKKDGVKDGSCPHCQTDQAPQTASTSEASEINSLVLGVNPAFSIDQTFMAQAVAQGQLFANMVTEQQRHMTQGAVTAVQIARKFYSAQSSSSSSSS